MANSKRERVEKRLRQDKADDHCRKDRRGGQSETDAIHHGDQHVPLAPVNQRFTRERVE